MGKFFAGLGAGSGMAAAGAVAVVLIGLAGWIQYDRSSGSDPVTTAAIKPEEAAPKPTASEPAATKTPQSDQPENTAAQQKKDDSASGEIAEAADEAASVTEDEVLPAEPKEVEPIEDVAEAAPVPPAFDEVRREQDGAMVIAGRAQPGAEVKILQDGTQIAVTTADNNGKFAAFATVKPDGKGHVLSLLEVSADGSLASDDQIILAPLAAPVVVAEAEEIAPAETSQEDATTGPAVATAETQNALAEAKPEKNDVGETVTAAASVETEEVAKPQSEAAVTATDEQNLVVAALPPEKADPQVKKAGPQEQDTVNAPTQKVAEPAEKKVAQQPVETSESAETASETASVKAEPVATSDAPVVAANEPQPPQPQPVPSSVASSDDTSANQTAETAPAVTSEEPADPKPDTRTASIEPKPETETAATPAQTPARQQVAVLKATEDGVALLNPVAPEVMDNVAIDTISYSETGAVQLAGRAQQGAETVRVYLDNTSVASLSVDDTGNWRGSLPQVDEGIYKLRVDEVAADGTVTSRVETPFKRESPEVLAAASADLEGPIKAITVQKGATLWAIARDRYGKGELYVRVFEANRASIRDPDLIYPGQIFDLPD